MQRVFYKKSVIPQLRGFCATYEEKSITKASQVLNLDKSTISVQIQPLEETLDVKLFEITNKSITATDAGHKLYKKAKNAVQLVEEIYNDFGEKHLHEKQLEIKIACHHFIASHFLPEVLQKLEGKLQKVTVALISRDEALKQLETGEVNIALYPVEENTFKEYIKYDIKPFKEYNVCFFSKKGNNNHSPSLKDMQNDFIHMGKKNITFNSAYEAIKHHQHSWLSLENGTWEVVKSFVKAGLGVSAMEREYVKDDDGLTDLGAMHHLPKIHHCIITHKHYEYIFGQSLFIKTIMDSYSS